MGQIYISYSQVNKEAALQIRDALEGWGHSVAMDDPDDPFDQELANKLDRGLRESQVFIALLSPSSVRSRTVRREIAIAKDLDKFIVPVMVEAVPSVIESADAKYIDATANLDVALSRLVKIADTHATRSVSRESFDEDDEEEDTSERRINPLIMAVFVVAIFIVILFVVIAFINQQPPAGKLQVDEIATATSQAIVATDMKLTLDARAIEAAGLESAATQAVVIQATSTAQAGMIAALEQTQIAYDKQATSAASDQTDSDEPISAPTGAADTGFSNEPTPTMEDVVPLDTPVPASPVPLPTEPVSSDEIAPPPAANDEQGSMLINPGFESFAPVSGLGQVAQGWTPWSITGEDVPSYQLAPIYDAVGSNTARIHDGINSQQYGSEFSTHDGGLYQRVTGITPGSKVRFSIWAYIWSSSFADVNRSEGSGDVTFQVGIDPSGGTDGESETIVWSEPVENYDAFNEYTIMATAEGDAVTVFIRSTVGFPAQVSTVYLDDALLMIE